MILFFQQKKANLSYKILSLIINAVCIFNLVFAPSISYAQAVLNTPPGVMLSPSNAFNPPLVRGIMVHPDNPLRFDFIIDQGDIKLEGEAFRIESTKLIKYFLAALAVPETQMWVNLSPYEKNRIIGEVFGQTEMGRDLLAQDYLLKQLTASLMYPDNKLGSEFWNRVYTRAKEEYGTTDIPMNTFNKIWIVPQQASVYEHQKGAFIIKSHLKVMLEEDYLALASNKNSIEHGLGGVKEDELKPLSAVQSQVIKEVLIPEIEKEVNEGETFANLRQIYNSVIMATWFKQSLKESLLGKIMVNQNKIGGLEAADKEANQKIYEQYLAAYKKGAFDLIKEEYNPEEQKVISRKYFSGGVAIEGTEGVVQNQKRNYAQLAAVDKQTIGLIADGIAQRSQIVGWEVSEGSSKNSAMLTPPDLTKMSWGPLLLDRSKRDLRDLIQQYRSAITANDLPTALTHLIAINEREDVSGELQQQVTEAVTALQGIIEASAIPDLTTFKNWGGLLADLDILTLGDQYNDALEQSDLPAARVALGSLKARPEVIANQALAEEVTAAIVQLEKVIALRDEKKVPAVLSLADLNLPAEAESTAVPLITALNAAVAEGDSVAVRNALLQITALQGLHGSAQGVVTEMVVDLDKVETVEIDRPLVERKPLIPNIHTVLGDFGSKPDVRRAVTQYENALRGNDVKQARDILIELSLLDHLEPTLHEGLLQMVVALDLHLGPDIKLLLPDINSLSWEGLENDAKIKAQIDRYNASVKTGKYEDAFAALTSLTFSPKTDGELRASLQRAHEDFSAFKRSIMEEYKVDGRTIYVDDERLSPEDRYQIRRVLSAVANKQYTFAIKLIEEEEVPKKSGYSLIDDVSERAEEVALQLNAIKTRLYELARTPAAAGEDEEDLSVPAVTATGKRDFYLGRGPSSTGLLRAYNRARRFLKEGNVSHFIGQLKLLKRRDDLTPKRMAAVEFALANSKLFFDAKDYAKFEAYMRNLDEETQLLKEAGRVAIYASQLKGKELDRPVHRALRLNQALGPILQHGQTKILERNGVTVEYTAWREGMINPYWTFVDDSETLEKVVKQSEISDEEAAATAKAASTTRVPITQQGLRDSKFFKYTQASQELNHLLGGRPKFAGEIKELDRNGVKVTYTGGTVSGAGKGLVYRWEVDGDPVTLANVATQAGTKIRGLSLADKVLTEAQPRAEGIIKERMRVSGPEFRRRKIAKADTSAKTLNDVMPTPTREGEVIDFEYNGMQVTYTAVRIGPGARLGWEFDEDPLTLMRVARQAGSTIDIDDSEIQAYMAKVKAAEKPQVVQDAPLLEILESPIEYAAGETRLFEDELRSKIEDHITFEVVELYMEYAETPQQLMDILLQGMGLENTFQYLLEERLADLGLDFRPNASNGSASAAVESSGSAVVAEVPNDTNGIGNGARVFNEVKRDVTARRQAAAEDAAADVSSANGQARSFSGHAIFIAKGLYVNKGLLRSPEIVREIKSGLSDFLRNPGRRTYLEHESDERNTERVYQITIAPYEIYLRYFEKQKVFFIVGFNAIKEFRRGGKGRTGVRDFRRKMKEVSKVQLPDQLQEKYGFRVFEGYSGNDKALLSDVADSTDPVGGIDLNPNEIDFTIKRDGQGVALPISQQPPEVYKIDNFSPVIIQIGPAANLQLLLGLFTTEQKPLANSPRSLDSVRNETFEEALKGI